MTQIYLISPENFELKDFSKELEIALKTELVPVFQMRVKNIEAQKIKNTASELKKICHDNNSLFILNDNHEIASEIGANGVHLGQDDKQIKLARRNSAQDFIIGASCYDSRDLAVNAVESGANYISFGTFFPSKTKNSKGKPSPEIISWANEIFDVQNCAIGGINAQNCSELVKNGADFLAVISYIWQNEKGIEYGLKKLNEAFQKA